MKDRRKKHIIIASVIALVLIGVGLAVFFCIPREPDVTFNDPTYSNLINTDNQFSITVQIPFTVDNPNYYDVKMKKLEMDIYYSGIYIGELVEENDYKFKKRGESDKVITTVISTTDTSVIPSIQDDIKNGRALSMRFSGKAKLEALSITITQNLSFSKNILVS